MTTIEIESISIFQSQHDQWISIIFVHIQVRIDEQTDRWSSAFIKMIHVGINIHKIWITKRQFIFLKEISKGKEKREHVATMWTITK